MKNKVLLIQFLGIMLVLSVEYFNLHPISTLLGVSNKYDSTSISIWVLLVVFPAIYGIYYKVKKAWLLISVAISPFILVGVLAMVVFIKEYV